MAINTGVLRKLSNKLRAFLRGCEAFWTRRPVCLTPSLRRLICVDSLENQFIPGTKPIQTLSGTSGNDVLKQQGLKRTLPWKIRHVLLRISRGANVLW
jgi:hypothetical protein